MEILVLIILAILVVVVLICLIIWPALLLFGAGFAVVAGAIKGRQNV